MFLSVNWLKNLHLKIILSLLFIAVLAEWGGIQSSVFSRLSNFGDLDVVSSENVRLYYPLLTMSDSIKHYPLFGIGVGNKEALVSISSILNNVNDYDLLNKDMLLGSFAIARIFTYFGLLGGGIFLFIINKTVLNLNASQFLKLSIFLSVLVFSIGTFEGVYFWCLLAVGYRSCLGNKKYD
jgi:hypothetical protein